MRFVGMTIMTRQYLVLVLGLFGPLSAPAFGADKVDPDNPPMGLFSDEWAEVYLAGNKIGYAHSTMTRDHNLIRSRSTMSMHLGRLDQPVKLEVIESATETVGGNPVSFENLQDLATMQTSTKGTVVDGKVTIVTSQLGMEQTQTFDYPAGAVLKTWGAYRESLLRGFAPGTEYTLQIYEPAFSMAGAVSSKTAIGDWEDFEHRGRKLRGLKVTAVMESPVGALTVVSWVKEDGLPLKAKVPVPGLGDLEIATVDQASALADFIPPEIFTKTVVKANRAIDSRTARRVTYRIASNNPDVDFGTLPGTAGQTARPAQDGSVEVTVTRQSYQAAADHNVQPPAAATSEFLGGNLMININDPTLIKLASRAAGDEKDPFALADKLRRFVTDYVQTKSLNIGFATASEVARTREGDCSEHGVLLAALGRLCGLPSRVVVGLVYLRELAGQNDVFGYHMWTEFMVGGVWFTYDAAMRESDCSPTRIAFATSSLADAGMADLTLPLLSKIGGLNIDILKVEPDPDHGRGGGENRKEPVD